MPEEFPNPEKVLNISTPSTPLLNRALPELPPTPTAPSTPTSLSTPNASRKNGPHLPVKLWLEKLELLDKYESVFKEYTGVEDLLDLDEREIKKMGVKNSAHRARIISSLMALKDKYNRSKYCWTVEELVDCY